MNSVLCWLYSIQINSLLIIQFVEMSSWTYNLKKFSQEETQFSQFNPYFAYLPYITNPTNNYLKYSNKDLNTLLVILTYGGDLQSEENQQSKKLYFEFAKDYQYHMDQFVREEQERQIKLQHQQLAAQQYNSNNTEPVAFNAGDQYNLQQYPYSQQQQPQYNQYYGQQEIQQGGYNRGYNQNQSYRGKQGHQYNREGQGQGQQYREGQGQYNREGQQYTQQPRDHQHQHYQNNYRGNQQQHGHQGYRKRDFHQKRQGQGQYDYQQQQAYQNQQQQPQLPQHQIAIYQRLEGAYQQGYIQATSQSDYEEITTIIQKYGYQIQVKYSPPVVLLQEDKPEPEVKPEPEPVVVEPIPEPKPEPKPKKFSIDEIKQFINSTSKQELEKHVNPQVVAMSAKINSWPTQQVIVEQKEDNKLNRKESKKPNDNKNNNKNNNYIKTGGVRKDEAAIAESLGYKPKESSGVQITIGKNQTLETRKMKEDIKNMAGKDFNTLKAKQYESLDHIEKCKKEIVYNLNLIVPQNLAAIEVDIIPYLFDDIDVCKVLIEEIIKKAWDQPKYASTYAKLCYDFSKFQSNKFKFQGSKKEKEGKKDNPFKYFLIDRVQHSFDQKIDKFPEFQSPEDKQIFLKDKKKHILSNVKFIAELILQRILKKKTMKYCISQLFDSFFKRYYAFSTQNKIENSIYDYYFEGIIEFIENIGSRYEELGEKEKEGKQPVYEYDNIRNHIADIIAVKAAPNNQILTFIENFNGEEYFKLLQFVDATFIRQKFPRLGALLQNLVERRGNKWQKHLSMAEGPKKIQQIQEDILREEDELQGKGKEKNLKEKEKQEQQRLDKKVKQLFEGWEMNKGQQIREIRQQVRKSGERAFYFSFLKQVADEKKDNVIKRVALFPVLLSERFSYKEFKNAWFDIIKYLAIGSGDYPFCGAALAQVIQLLLAKEGKIEDFFRKYDEDEEQDEVYFIEEIFQKYYHYSQDEGALKFVKPKPKLSGLI